MASKHSLLIPTRYVIAVLGLATTSIMGSCLLAYRASQQLETASRGIGGTQDMILDLQAILHHLIDSETNQRGFLVTRREEYVGPALGIREKVDERLATLRTRVASDPAQSRRVEALSALIDRKLDEMETTIELWRVGNLRQALAMVQPPDGASLMQDIRQILHDAEQHELVAFRARSDAASVRSARYQRAGAVLVVLALILAGLAAFLLHRRVRELESFITICAWTKRVRYQDRWVPFEEFLQKRYGLRLSHGISDEAANAEMERARDFFEPVDPEPQPETTGDKA